MNNFSDYIIFVDESGSPTLTTIDSQYPIFVLVFCIVEKNIYAERIQPALKKLKFEFFGHDMAVLHAHDIRKPKGDFAILLNPEIREYFLRRLSEIMDTAEIKIIVNVIDKTSLKNKYANPFDPYNIALRMCLEQTSLFLKEYNQSGKLTHIIVESRGKKEDANLKLEFGRIIDPSYDWGLARKFSIKDTPFDLKFVDKAINSSGLQLADLVGQPIGRHIINPDQSNRSFDIVEKKIWKKIWKFP